MQPQGSLPHSQVPVTCPYPEPARSSPYPTFYFLKIYLNIILPSTPGFPKWFLSSRFPHQIPVYASPLPHMCYLPRPSHSSLIGHPKNIGWPVQIIQLLITQHTPLPCYLIPPRPKYSPQHPILKHSQRSCLPQFQRPNFTPKETLLQAEY